MAKRITSTARSEVLQDTLERLRDGTPGVTGAALVEAEEGLVIASALSAEINAETLAAVAGLVLGTSERTARELKKGDVKRMVIKGEEGQIVVFTVPKGKTGAMALLVTVTTDDAKLGMVFLDMTTGADELAEVI